MSNFTSHDPVKALPASVLLENGLGGAAVFKSDGVANFLSKHDVHLVGHPLGHAHGSHPPGLSAGHGPLGTGQAPHHVHAPLGDLEIQTQGFELAAQYNKKKRRSWCRHFSKLTVDTKHRRHKEVSPGVYF